MKKLFDMFEYVSLMSNAHKQELTVATVDVDADIVTDHNKCDVTVFVSEWSASSVSEYTVTGNSDVGKLFVNEW